MIILFYSHPTRHRRQPGDGALQPTPGALGAAARRGAARGCRGALRLSRWTLRHGALRCGRQQGAQRWNGGEKYGTRFVEMGWIGICSIVFFGEKAGRLGV